MSCYVIACRGRVEEEVLPVANKSIAKRVAMCIATLSPTVNNLSDQGVKVLCVHEYGQLQRAIGYEEATPTAISSSSSSDVVIIISAKLRPQKQSPQPSFAMDIFNADVSQKPVALQELGNKIGETFGRSAKTVTLIMNSMGDLTRGRAIDVIKSFREGVMEGCSKVLSSSSLPSVRCFVSLNIDGSTSNKLEAFVAKSGGSTFEICRQEQVLAGGWEYAGPDEGSIWVSPEVDEESLLDSSRTEEGGEEEDAAPPPPRPSPPKQQQAAVRQETQGTSQPATAAPNPRTEINVSSASPTTRENEQSTEIQQQQQQPATVGTRVDPVPQPVKGVDEEYIRSIWSNSMTTAIGTASAPPPGVIQKPSNLDFYCNKCFQRYSDPATHALVCVPKVTVHAVAENPLPDTPAFQECNAFMKAGIITVTEEVIPGSQVTRKPNPNSKELLPSERWCDLCGMQVNGEKNWMQHIAGEKHMRLTEKSMTPMMQRAYNCLTCNTKVYGESNLLQHIGGGKHLKAAENRVHTCRYCDIVCTGDRKYVEHLQSDSHKLNSCPMY